MAKYRRRFDILADMVRVASSGAKKTKIMYFANLSYLLLNKYLDEAMHTGFLRYNGEEYLTTRKGGAFLERYNDFRSRYSRVNADLEELKSEAERLERMCRPRRWNNRNAKKNRSAALV